MTTRLYKILENISDESQDFRFSDKHKGAGYHSVQGGNHTAVYELENFIGSVSIQGTLMERPGELDWVDVSGTLITNTDSSSMTESTSRNFQGNFMWIRAKYQLTNGKIANLSYNY
jgi:23S rRNA A2030 N6-methylase RlmJ